MKTAYLSLGSNLGDREAHLEEALRELELNRVHVLRRSSIYETEPQDLKSQPYFLNMAVAVETALFPIQLLNRIRKIEHALGRKRLIPKGPRTIDIDLLFYGNSILDTPELTVPHRRLDQRRFVLEPLAEIAPELRHPLHRKTVRELLEGVQDQSVRNWNPYQK